MLANEIGKEVQTVDLTDSRTDFSEVSLEENDVAVIAVPSYGGRVPGRRQNALRLSGETGRRPFLSVFTVTVLMKTRLLNCRTLQNRPDSLLYQQSLPSRNIRLHGSSQQAGRMQRMRQNFMILPIKSGQSWKQRIFRNRRSRAIARTKRAAEPGWCQSPRRNV